MTPENNAWLFKKDHKKYFEIQNLLYIFYECIRLGLVLWKSYNI